MQPSLFVIQSAAKDPVSHCTYGLPGTKWILRYALDDKPTISSTRPNVIGLLCFCRAWERKGG